MREQEELEILNLLKERLIKAAKQRNLNLSNSHFGWNKKKDSNKKEFYLKVRDNNLFEKPNRKVKLGTGVEAVRSSAAMIFNLLGQTSVSIKKKLYCPPEYEKEYKAIKDEKESKHNANLDAILRSEDEIIAIEAKMLEWKGCPKNLSKAYLNPEMYLCNNSKIFIEIFENLIKDKNKEDSKRRYFHKYNRYDAIQMTIHILALYKACFDEKEKMPKNIKLLNIVWKYDCDDYKTEEKESKEFITDYGAKFKDLFKKKGFNFSVEYITFQDFINKEIDFPKNSPREKYLKIRYLIQD